MRLCRIAPPLSALLAALLVCAGATHAETEYKLKGKLEPATRAALSLDGFSTTYAAAVLSSADGTFEFKSLRAGTYTLIVAVPNRGEMRRTVEIGAGAATAKGVVELTVPLDERLWQRTRSPNVVELRELAIPEAARKAWDKALQALAKRNADAAIEQLKEAVRLAPDWSMAWNNLGTLYYKSRRWAEAEHAFREAVESNAQSFEARVNLGGVLLTLNRPDEAYAYNLYCVLERPTDALANAQLGLNNFALGRLELARRYLNVARTIDPAHFSHPQLTLADIALRQGNRRIAIQELKEFLRYHPDAGRCAQIEEGIKRLQAELDAML